MIIDQIENYKIYSSISERISIAFDFIIKTDLNSLNTGKHIIQSDKIIAICQEYRTRTVQECKLEGHIRYLDLQYLIEGSEIIGFKTLRNQIPVEENKEDDYSFYSDESSLINFSKGMFAIFFPQDLHMPCIMTNKESIVKKIVIKILIE